LTARAQTTAGIVDCTTGTTSAPGRHGPLEHSSWKVPGGHEQAVLVDALVLATKTPGGTQVLVLLLESELMEAMNTLVVGAHETNPGAAKTPGGAH